MRRILVVANQTLGGDHLAEVIRARAAEGPVEVLLMVPATHHTDLLVALAEAFAVQGGMRPPAENYDGDVDAKDRAGAGTTWLTGLGVSATAEVVAHDPLPGIREALARREVDEVIVSTLPAGVSRWLHQDLAHRIRRVTDAPVTVVTADHPGDAAPTP
ncbi:MAG TPA: hypothetical protein VIU11_19765 [Nakamurella sp.]